MAFDIPYGVCVLGMAVLTAVYVILGGYMATAINDFIRESSCWPESLPSSSAC